MKRTLLSLAVLAVVAACMSKSGSANSQAIQQARAVNVSMNPATCPPDTSVPVSITVAPWTVVVSRTAGDTITWNLPTGADSMVIYQSTPGPSHWPFVNNPSTARAGQAGRSGQQKPNFPLGRYGYTLILYCGTSQIQIDPEVDVEDN